MPAFWVGSLKDYFDTCALFPLSRARGWCFVKSAGRRCPDGALLGGGPHVLRWTF